jgi:hypothetical protein
MLSGVTESTKELRIVLNVRHHFSEHLPWNLGLRWIWNQILDQLGWYNFGQLAHIPP